MLKFCIILYKYPKWYILSDTLELKKWVHTKKEKKSLTPDWIQTHDIVLHWLGNRS